MTSSGSLGCARTLGARDLLPDRDIPVDEILDQHKMKAAMAPGLYMLAAAAAAVERNGSVHTNATAADDDGDGDGGSGNAAGQDQPTNVEENCQQFEIENYSSSSSSDADDSSYHCSREDVDSSNNDDNSSDHTPRKAPASTRRAKALSRTTTRRVSGTTSETKQPGCAAAHARAVKHSTEQAAEVIANARLLESLRGDLDMLAAAAVDLEVGTALADTTAADADGAGGGVDASQESRDQQTCDEEDCQEALSSCHTTASSSSSSSSSDADDSSYHCSSEDVDSSNNDDSSSKYKPRKAPARKRRRCAFSQRTAHKQVLQTVQTADSPQSTATLVRAPDPTSNPAATTLKIEAKARLTETFPARGGNSTPLKRQKNSPGHPAIQTRPPEVARAITSKAVGLLASPEVVAEQKRCHPAANRQQVASMLQQDSGTNRVTDPPTAYSLDAGRSAKAVKCNSNDATPSLAQQLKSLAQQPKQQTSQVIGDFVDVDKIPADKAAIAKVQPQPDQG